MDVRAGGDCEVGSAPAGLPPRLATAAWSRPHSRAARSSTGSGSGKRASRRPRRVARRARASSSPATSSPKCSWAIETALTAVSSPARAGRFRSTRRCRARRASASWIHASRNPAPNAAMSDVGLVQFVAVEGVGGGEHEDLADHVGVLLVAAHEADDSPCGGGLDDGCEASRMTSWNSMSEIVARRGRHRRRRGMRFDSSRKRGSASPGSEPRVAGASGRRGVAELVQLGLDERGQLIDLR